MPKKKEEGTGSYRIPMAARLSGKISVEDLLTHDMKLGMRKQLRDSMKGTIGGPTEGNPMMTAIKAVMVNKLVNQAMRQLTAKKPKKAAKEEEEHDGQS